MKLSASATRESLARRHEYSAGLRVLAGCLEQTPDLKVKVAAADGARPEGPQLLGKADAVVQGGLPVNVPEELLQKPAAAGEVRYLPARSQLFSLGGPNAASGW